MKKYFILALTLTLTLFSCSSSDDNTPLENTNYAMTAKINGIIFQANNPFGTNEFSSTTIFNYYPEKDYILLIGRQGGPLGNSEIKIWLKKSDIVVGAYEIGQETFETPPSHFISLLDNSNEISEYTKAGTIVITEVDSSTKIVMGTFQFTTVDETNNPSSPIGFDVTEGTFRYKYE